jgi:hypothetical protein
MRRADKGVIFGVALAALAIAFYMLVLAPKRDEAGKLQTQIDDLNASISQQQQVAEFGEQARSEFPRYYGHLVVLGKAVPPRADTSSMIVQLNSVANGAQVKLNSIALSQGGSSTDPSATTTTPAPTAPTPTAPTPTAPTPTAPASSPSGTTTAATPATGTAPATEASAALQPLGAIVGPAGLPTLPYDLGFQGSFFDVADFIGGLDDLVTPTDGGASVSPDGRLFTIDGFSLSGGGQSPTLDANFLVTTYVTPEDQGLTAGASPSGPAPVTPGETETQPASAVVAK